MDLILKRTEYGPNGIFGILSDTQGSFICHTLEHAYQINGNYEPKTPVGEYRCVRGPHRLHSGPIETFEIMDVLGHYGILIHPGNYNKDSDGCVLVGSSRVGSMVTNSQATFKKFMELQSQVNEFVLKIVG